MKFIKEFIGLIFSEFFVESSSETFKEFRVVFKAKNYQTVPFENFESHFSFLQIRDTIHISVTFGESEPVIINSEKLDFEGFIRKLDQEALYLEDEEISIVITINKNVKEGCCTIYDLDCFVNTLTGYGITQFFQTFSKLLEYEHTIKFNVFNIREPFNTKSLLFTSLTDDKPEQKPSNRKEIFEAFKSHCHFSNFENFVLIPNDFKLINRDTSLIRLNELFDRYSNLLSIIYLFDITSVTGNTLEYKINGYKSIKGTVEIEEFSSKEFTQYFEIYDWVYNGGNLNDKIGLARNIISLHFKDSDNLSLQGSPLQSVKSSFKVYEKENIKQYIEIRNKISDQLLDFNNRANKIVETFASGFQKSTLALISFYISAVVIRILSKGDFINVFSLDATILSLAFLSGSIIYYFVSRWEIKEQRKRFTSSYSNLKERYTDLLEPDDIKRILNNDSEYNQDLAFIDKKRRVYSVMWIAVVIILGSTTLFLYGIYNFTQLSDGYFFQLLFGSSCDCG